jgi:thiamine-phosphate pyrophosphorylase
MVRYAITSGEYGLLSGNGPSLLQHVHRLARDRVEFLQLREKHLEAGELATLAREILKILASYDTPTRLLINTRADVALATGAHGVHLTRACGNLTPTQIRTLYRTHGLPEPTVSQACHTRGAILNVLPQQPDLILYSPVFGKGDLPGTGLEELKTACTLAAPIPVLALGGVTALNTASCLHAGAAGVAGIRLFQA